MADRRLQSRRLKPFLVLFEQHGTDKTDHRDLVGERGQLRPARLQLSATWRNIWRGFRNPWRDGGCGRPGQAAFATRRLGNATEPFTGHRAVRSLTAGPAPWRRRRSVRQSSEAALRYRPGVGLALHLLDSVATLRVVFAAPFFADVSDCCSTAAVGLLSHPRHSHKVMCNSAKAL